MSKSGPKKIPGKLVNRVFVEIKLKATHDKCALDGADCAYLKKQTIEINSPSDRYKIGFCTIFQTPLTDFDNAGYMNRCQSCLTQSTIREVRE